MSQELDDAKDAMIDGLFRFIDRMNDYCEQDPAERILDQFTAHMAPLFDEYFHVRHGHPSQVQLPLEFRSPEQIEADRQSRLQRRRPRFVLK